MSIKKTIMALILVAGLAIPSGSLLAANGGKSKDLTGSWLVSVQPQGGSSFRGLITFNGDGGLVASAQGDVLLSPPPGVSPVGTAGHGSWVKSAKDVFTFSFVQILYGSDGSYEGMVKLMNVADLDATGNEWSATFVVDILDANGNVVFTGQGNAQATRIRAEP